MNHKGVFPFEPLHEALKRRLPEIAVGRGQFVDAGDFYRASDLLGVSRRALERWKHGQPLTLEYADRCATRLGLHPTRIWPDFNEICDRLDAEAEQRRQRAVADRQRRNAARSGRQVAVA